jgi:hypothetical protein
MLWRTSFSFKSVSCVAALCSVVSSLAGCSLPEAGVLTGHTNKKEMFYAVVRGVQCEIHQAIYEEVNLDRDSAQLGWLKQ